MANTPKNNIKALYDIIFDELRDLRAGKTDVSHANAVSNLANSLTKAGELECRFLEINGGTGTGFVPESEDESDNGLPRRQERPKLVKSY